MFLKNATDFFKRLFWAMQIRILCSCPPLWGIAFQSGMSADRSREAWLKTLFRVAVRMPLAIFIHLYDKTRKRVVLPRVAVSVTLRCTLNCDNCIGYMPDNARLGDIPASDIIRDVRALFSNVDYIYDLNLTGGEPFLHPDLDQIILACVEPNKVGHVDVSTNGTVIPGTKALAALRKANATVRISKYLDELQPNVEKLKCILKENEIHFMHEECAFWYDPGDRAKTMLRDGMERRRFSICVLKLCLAFYNGKLHLCHTSVLMEFGVIPVFKEDFIDLRMASPAAFREQWRTLQRKRVLSACSYCTGFSYKTPRIPVAVQREHAATQTL